MKIERVIFVVILILALGIGARVQAQTPATAAEQSRAPAAPSNIASSSVRIVSPRGGQKIRDNYVDVRFELTNPAATVNTPTFMVQLDGRDPVQTTSTDQTFSGLKTGVHTVFVQLVDANGTPIMGSRAQVQFIVAPQQPAATQPSGGQSPRNQGNGQAPEPQLQTISLQQVPPSAAQQNQPEQKDQKKSSQDQSDDALPSSGSALPLLSLIGFGVLVGGITSALKTR